MYDITDRDSFNAVHNWMSMVGKYADNNITCILIGNKTDLEEHRVVTLEEGQEMADQYCMRFLETSAKDGDNVNKAFYRITRKIKSDVFQVPKNQKDKVSDKVIRRNSK